MCLPRDVWYLVILAVLVVFYEEETRNGVAVVNPCRGPRPASTVR